MSAKNENRPVPPAPEKLILSVFSDFKASHSLAGFETPHFHLWKLAIEFTTSAPFEGDRLIDLTFLKEEIHAVVAPIENRFLNSLFDFQPTTENIAQWLWKQVQARLPEAPLTAVQVSLCDLDGTAMGSARLVRA